MQSISQAKRQQQVLDSGYLDLNGDQANRFKPFSGDAIAIALFNVAAEFVNKAADNLNKVDRTASGALEGSIKPTDIIIMGKVMTVNINVNDYYKFVDKGVKGWKSGTPGDSPYSFKAPSGKRGSAPKNSKMVASIKQWLISEGLKSRGAENKNPIVPREGRRNKITDATTSAAILATMMIKRKGLKKTNFWTDTEGQIQSYIAKEFETALKIDIINSLTK